MDQELNTKLSALEAKVDIIYQSVEKTRRYFLITMWVTVLAIVLPLIGLALVIPSFISNYTSTLSGLGL